ncbi:MAG: nucleotide exchange factor GrpE [Pyrinomonadaceae bacterium]
MNSKEQIPKPEESVDVEVDPTSTVDDFIRELEAKEKDLQITSDMQIEVAEPEFDASKIPAFVEQDLKAKSTGAASPPAGSSGLKTRVYELESLVGSLEEKLKNLRAERNEIQEKSDRRLKDFENYKYRMDRERRGAFIDQISSLACQMLPVLDNLDRAIDSVANLQNKGPEFQQFYDGIALVNQHVNEVFAEMGVQPIASVGDVFDPNFHEAVAAEEREDLPVNTISEEMLRGYRIGNRVIRHSMVKVTTHAKKYRFDQPDPEPASEPEAEVPPADDPAAAEE